MNHGAARKVQLFCIFVCISFFLQGSIDIKRAIPPESATTNGSLFNNNGKVEDELSTIQQAIEDSEASWTADYTSAVAMLSIGENIGLGCRNEELEKPDYVPPSNNMSLPDSFDWRNFDQVDWMTSIRNQAGCGSCVAFGILGAVEAVVQIETGQPFNVDLSEAFLFFCGGGTCDTGWFVNEAAKYLVNNGVPDEACFPYQDYDMDCSDKATNWRDRLVHVADYGTVSDNVGFIKEALIEHGPLVTTMTVYRDFYYYHEGVYEPVSTDLEGYHAVAIVGYNDDPGYWICKNSWGAGWGEEGWFNIKYRKSDIGQNTKYFTGISGNLPPIEPDHPNPINDAAGIDTDTVLQWTCNDYDGDTLSYDVYLSEGSHLEESDLLAHDHPTSSLEVMGLHKNTVYYWQVIARDEHGSERSSPVWQFRTVEDIPPLVAIDEPKASTLYWHGWQLPLLSRHAFLLGEQDVTIETSDEESGIETVELYLNGELITQWSEGSDYTYHLKITSFGFPLYTLKVIASDRVGNTAMDEVTLRVFNL
jgi:hypothetical protein